MEVEWDEAKDRANIEKHGISFDEARRIFDGPVLTKVDDRSDYGEIREISLGLLSPDSPLMVVHTLRGRKTRLISARKANRQERKVYCDYLERTLERN
ncbi:MAG: BrnT family toxin [Alphaproteobacteria bacterium]|nr:BrnT family toxin [Alphaproteobacteria bacterium]